MEITDSTLGYAAVSSGVSYTEVREELTITGPGERAPGRAPEGRLRGLAGLDGPSPRRVGHCDCEGPHRRSGEVKNEAEAKLAVAIDLIERLTGREFDVLDPDDLEGRRAKHDADRPPGPAGPTIEYSRIETRVELQSVRVAAQGTVTTGDGRTIELDLQLAMDRAYAERSETHVRIGPPPTDPLVVDLGSSPGAIGAQRVAFDLDADGTLEEVPWASGGSAFLALDRNGDGMIGDGSELFGPTTGSGYGELAALDDDGDGWIDEDDAAWSRLRLVTGSTAVAATRSLAEAGVGAIATSGVAAELTERDASGAVVAQQREVGVYLREDGGAGTVRQLDLSV